MTMVSTMGGRAGDGYSQLVRELQVEFRHGDVWALADRIVESEAADFYWEARLRERYLGQHFDADMEADEAGDELVRVAMLSFFARRWHVGICLVDGEGRAVGLLWLRNFEGRAEAKLRSQGRGDRGWFDETGAARGVAPISVERGVIGVGGGRERGRQDKGSCSQPSLTFCLHISISRDTGANRETLLSLKPEGDQ